ncbi:MAG: dipicolinate synthase [Lachnospiraceae bacterium]|nr:dipicolinate synthase [Lachnospiraceae bacterium]
MTKYDIAIIGGDRRTACMIPILAEKGYRIICFRTVRITYSPSVKSKLYFAKSLREALDSTSVIIGGIPFTKSDSLYCEEEVSDATISISEIQRSIHKHQKIFAGIIPESFRRTCEEREISCYDFMLDEPITLYNAVSTAEGAILEALLHKNTNLHMSKTLVLGYGRCGKVIADRLNGLHACVTVCSNDANELALACALGFETMHLSNLWRKICCYEYIFNTIPARVLNRRCLEKVASNAIIIDIASNKTGADYEIAEKLGVNIRFCPGLPGKYAGESCAKYLTDYVTTRI